MGTMVKGTVDTDLGTSLVCGIGELRTGKATPFCPSQVTHVRRSYAGAPLRYAGPSRLLARSNCGREDPVYIAVLQVVTKELPWCPGDVAKRGTSEKSGVRKYGKVATLGKGFAFPVLA